MGAFSFVDRIVEVKDRESLTAVYRLTGREEFLKDHFDGFPVMPGVLMLESLKQAAAALLSLSENFAHAYYRLVLAEDLKFGQFVKPGSQLKLAVRHVKTEGEKRFIDGRIDLLSEDGSSVLPGRVLSASIVLAPVSCSPKEKLLFEKSARLALERIA